MCSSDLVPPSARPAHDSPRGAEAAGAPSPSALSRPHFLLKFKPVKADLIEKKLPEKRNVNIDRNNKISGEALQKFTETTFAEVLKEKKNMVYSPISLYVALSMLTESSQDNPVLLKLLSGKSVENIRNINKEILSEQYKGKNGTTVFANSNWIRKGNEPYKSLMLSKTLFRCII